MCIRDRKYNRLAIQKLCKNAKVLDCFTHTGSFALNAGIAGAESVLGVDASDLAVNQARENADLNGLSDRVKFISRDVFELLPEPEKQGEKYDVVDVYKRQLLQRVLSALHGQYHGSESGL